MAHSHSHTSSHLPEDNNARRLLYAFGVTAGFMLVEVVGGLQATHNGLLDGDRETGCFHSGRG